MKVSTKGLARHREGRCAGGHFLLGMAVLALGWCAVSQVRANPQGMTVVNGTATASRNGSVLNITASQNAVINWQSFNIAAGEMTRFWQPSSRSVVWNQIFDRNPSQIWGSLQANGTVVLMNQNGFYFGPHCQVNVGGFVAASAAVLPPAGVGGFWTYQGPPPTANIINYGQIRADPGGSIFLIAEGIENHGLISAPDGKLGLYAGKHVLLSERPDGRGVSAAVDLPQGSIDNQGRLIADAGAISLRAQVINQNGLIQANSVRSSHGTIELVASDAVNLGSHSVLSANGDSSADSSGGRISLDSAQTFVDDPDSIIDVRGGGQGGDGGQVQLCALTMNGMESQLDGTAQRGWRGGSLLLDPLNITLTANTGRTTPVGTVGAGDPPTTGTLTLNVNRSFIGFSQIDLQALQNINIGLPSAGNAWNLDTSTGINAPGSLLTLEAGNNITFYNNSRIFSAGGWSISMAAGVDFTSPTHAVRSGIGGIYLNGGPSNPGYNGALETASGNITLEAGHEVLVGSGYIRTIGGGDISIITLDGNVDAGTKADTYDFSSTGYTISAQGLGGIGTEAGGDVAINAGQDILSLQSHIGTFGPEAGNLALQSGRDIRGNFMVENGTASVIAGRNIGSAGTGASFGLSHGGWSLHADQDLYLNEIFNPSGSLNANRSVFGPRLTFQFDYGANAYANLFGGHSIVLTGDNIAHTADNPVRQDYAIYPPILSMDAGAGGITLDKDVILYPSSLGSLQVVTTDGGSFGSAPSQFSQLVVSDSGSADYRTFANGHAAVPLHLGGTGAGVSLDISGDLDNLFLRSPEQASIRVHHNVDNFSFEGQNLSGHDATRIQIDGNFFSRSDLTFVTLASPADLALLTDPIASMDPDLGARLLYNPITHQLGLQGIMTSVDLNFLLHPTVYAIDPRTGEVALDPYGNAIVRNATFTTDTAALRRLFALSQDIPNSPLAALGLQLGGPGQFVVSAHNMDLGSSAGIRSVGPLVNPSLARVSLAGASVTLNLSGNLNITSSQIASFNGGNIAINSLGSIEVGSQNSYTSDDTPKGIYTAHGGSVTVQAVGDINVDGSRIATYDGGDINVISLDGNVDAGAGARGFFSVTTSEWDPVLGQVVIRNDRFFGSGIMAVTRTDSDAHVGNINVRAGGDILANAGGIIQLAFNQTDQSSAGMDLYAAGSIIADQSGILGHVRSIHAGGDVLGSIVSTANNPVVIQLGGNFIGTVISSGGVSVKAGGSISGSIVGAGNVSVSGSEITASVISTGGNANTSGNTAGGTVGAFTSVAAPAAQKTADAADKTVAASDSSTLASDDDEKKKHAGQNPVLVRRVGRVTVILPDSGK